MVLSLIQKCHEAGYPVICNRLACEYYRGSLHGEDLGLGYWSELAVLNVGSTA
ncbi:hypothetical protein [Nostoc sp. UHCC 0302]|uniref:hypothetical protein n=1 Tax=Nostoc sp. UHCC 0302 TaxID=3134896 RepID=UPI00311CC373